MMKKTVLLVDDEAMHREFLFHSLNEDYDLWIASNFEKALFWIEFGLNISILVTDFNLSDSEGRTGLDLVEALRGREANAKIILHTGAILTEAEEKRLADQRAKLVEKPCPVEAILKLVS